jgi:hypothetical protein
MELLILLLVAAAWYYIARDAKRRQGSPQGPASAMRDQPASRTRHVSPIPKGYQIFSEGLSVAGVHKNKHEAARFAKAGAHALRLEREPANSHDPNAIKVFGTSGAAEYFLGYVPKEMSAQLAATQMFERVQPRLTSIYLGQGQFIDIEFQVLGPKSEKARFDDYLKQRPATGDQHEYLDFFGIASTGMTAGEAERAILEHQAQCSPGQAVEWRAYSSIVEDFEDPGFRESFDLKKVCRTTLAKTLKQLKEHGKNYCYLDENVEEVVDAILEMKPELAKA